MEPLFYIAPGTGVVSSRSGWGKDDIQLLVKIGPTRESHEERAIGAFLIYQGGWLASSAKMATKSGIAQDTIDWCTLTLDGARQTWTQDTAKIVPQEFTDTYAYVVGDLKGAYSAQVTAYRREYFHLLPGYLLVRDAFSLVNLNSKAVWHLHSLTQPVTAPGSFRAGNLFGVIVSPQPAILSWIPYKQTTDQPQPTYRIDLQVDNSPALVAMEVASSLSGRTLGTVVTTAGVQGIVCGTSFVAWLTGAGPWSYLSPTMGVHWLLGLKPSTIYQVNGSSVTSSHAGVMSISNYPAGTGITVTEGNVVPPTVLTVTGYSANPVESGASFQINGTGFDIDTTAAYLGQPLSITVVAANRLRAQAPSSMLTSVGPVVVTSGGRSAAGPPLTVNPVPPPPQSYTITGTVVEAADGSMSGSITMVPKNG